MKKYSTTLWMNVRVLYTYILTCIFIIENVHVMLDFKKKNENGLEWVYLYAVVCLDSNDLGLTFCRIRVEVASWATFQPRT